MVVVRALRNLGLVVAAGAVGGAVYASDLTNSPWWSSLAPVRFSRATFAVLMVSADYKWNLRNLESGTEEYRSTMKQIHHRSALRLREMCRSNGGLFIKVGQHIGSLEYLLPTEYVKTFKVFHSSAPATPLYRLKEVVREEFGVPAEELFLELSEEPLGAASLAQCHQGVLRDSGKVVAVKIQHPDVKKNADTDMDMIDLLVACVSYLFPDFHFQWLAREVRTNLPNELNFCHEARNQEKFSAMFKHLPFIKAPEVYWKYTSKRVLTMEFCEGGKLDDLEYIKKHTLPVDEISSKLGQMYSEMIFQRGYIHCDPHPGNVLVRRKVGDRGRRGRGEVEIVLLDHGLYTILTEDFRMTYCHLWQALINRDQPAIKRYCEELNAGQLYRLLACIITARAWDSIASGIDQNPRSQSELRRMKVTALMFMSEITQLLDTIPRQLVLILKTNDLLRSSEHVLGASNHKQSFLTMSKSCVRAIGEHKAAQCNSWAQRLLIRARTGWTLLLVNLYEIWLHWKAMTIRVNDT